MRTFAVVSLLLSAPLVALAADPPGGPGWYQSLVGFNVSTTSGVLIIAADTPGKLLGTKGTLLQIRFERGIALWLGKEIKEADGELERALLTLYVSADMVRAFIKQPLSKLTPTPPGNGPGNPNQPLSGPFPGTAASVGGRVGGALPPVSAAAAAQDFPDARPASPPTIISPPRNRPGGVDVVPGASSAPASGAGSGGTARVIAREDHDAWLAKVLRLWGEEGARCETKAYGPGWVSICEPRSA